MKKIMLVCLIVLLGLQFSGADAKSPKKKPLTKKEVQAFNALITASINSGVEFLLAQMNEKGACELEIRGRKFADPGITSLVLTALAKSGSADPKVKTALVKGAAFLASLQKPDGGIYVNKNAAPPTYVTAVAVMAITEIDKKKYASVLKKAQNFLLGVQGTNAGDKGTYGGFSYGPGSNKKKNDVSATGYALEALKESGCSDLETYKRAVEFLNRCQNDSESNDLPKAGNDGGFVYTPVVEKREGSYGTMTYAGLKSYVYAGMKKDDKRIKAALKWISDNYSVEKNPGMKDGNMGLYYYFQVMSKTFTILGMDTVKDSAGMEHDWRAELSEHILSLQKEDGSWMNSQGRFYENMKPLATAYAVYALSNCRKQQY